MHIDHENIQEVVDAAVTAAASGKHHTATDDGAWDGAAAEKNLGGDPSKAALRRAYAWVDDDTDGTKAAHYAFPHHFVSDTGGVGAASTKACSTGIATLNGAHGGSSIPAGDRQGVFDHLSRHLADGGVAQDDLPQLKSAELAANMAAAHGKVNGVHSHAHPTYGAQGGDRSHEHPHHHAQDSNHGHDHSAKMPGRTAAAWPAGQTSMVAAGTVGEPTTTALAASAAEAWREAGNEPLAALLASAYADLPEGGSLVAAAVTALGAPWGVEQRGDGWALLGRDGEAGTFASYAEALADLAGKAFVAADRPVLDDTWRSEMCYEDVETGDGRYIAPGALQYRDCPLPLMLQTVTDIGHFGAVLSGSILTAKTVNGTAIGSGEFDDSDAGRQSVDIINARGRFGVSIDGMSPAEAEFECTKRDDEDGYCIDGRMRFNLLTVGGLTLTPFPAFKDAFIALEQRAQAASGAPDEADGVTEPCVDCGDQPREDRRAAGGVRVTGKQDPAPFGKEDPEAFTAAGEPSALPYPADWFADPGFAVGDGRVVLQPDGRHYACPHTVTADGRVFGTMAGWFTCHTGYAQECVTPPRSRSGYAAFMLRPVMTADGQVVRIGHLTMGCGHADTDRPLPVGDVRAHYDGGPGAARMAYVACGEDEFGIWYSGGVNPAATPDQVREFAACSVSGDWREVWRGRGLDLVACLAGVTVPGFPVASALAAAGITVADPQHPIPADPVARFVDGRPVALVAAGVVRRPLPWERQAAETAARLDRIESLLADVMLVASPLRPLAVDTLVAATLEAANGNHA